MSKCRGPPFLFSIFLQIENRKGELHVAEKYIYVTGKKIHVSDEVYKVYKKQINYDAHLNRKDRKHKVYSFEDYNVDINTVVDESVDIEKIIETKMRIEDLYRALDSLNTEERDIIESLYFDDKTLVEVAKQQNTNSMKISRLRNKILKKLRKLLDS